MCTCWLSVWPGSSCPGLQASSRVRTVFGASQRPELRWRGVQLAAAANEWKHPKCLKIVISLRDSNNFCSGRNLLLNGGVASLLMGWRGEEEEAAASPQNMLLNPLNIMFCSTYHMLCLAPKWPFTFSMLGTHWQTFVIVLWVCF